MLNASFAMALHMSKGAEPTRYAALKTYVDATARASFRRISRASAWRNRVERRARRAWH